ncbi:MAG: hypothetical protein ACLQIB_10790, partial [Isosphaeraceae bacterium]
MTIDRAPRAPWSGCVWLSLALLALLSHPGLAQEPARDAATPGTGFGESRRGDVPSGTLEMMTTETDQAIQSGLAWLARSQSADGSFGS